MDLPSLATILQHLNSFATEFPWEVILASGILSPVMVPIIKLFKVQKDTVKIGLVYVGGVIFAAVHYFITTPSSDPTVIYMQGAILAFTAQPFYHLMVKPGFAYLGTEISRAVALKEKQDAVLPPSLAGPDASDFSS